MLAWRPPWDDSEVCSNPDSLSRDAMSTPGLFEFHPSNDAPRYPPGFPDHHRSGYRRPPHAGTGATGICLRTVFGARVRSATHSPLSGKSRCRSITQGVRLDCGYRLDFLVAGIVVVE